MMRVKVGWSSVRGAGTQSSMGGLIFRGVIPKLKFGAYL